MDEPRDWRSAKAPKWAIDAAEAEVRQWRRSAALSWPTEQKPEPLPFRWVEYDRLVGEPVPGVYWAPRGKYVERVEFRLTSPEDTNDRWRPYRFRAGEKWTSSVARGPLYATERDAWLAVLWAQCEEAADLLMSVRSHL